MAFKYISPTGSDGAAGDIATPWLNAKYGLEHVSPGDTVYARGGSYNQIINDPNASGTSWAVPITLKAYPGESPVFTPTAGAVGYDNYGINLSFTQKYLIFDGIKMDATSLHYGAVHIDASVAVSRNPHHIRFVNCEIITNTNSVVVTPGLQASGILMSESVSGLTGNNEIIDCTIHGSTAYGIYCSGNTNLMSGNNIYDHNVAGIHISNAAGAPCVDNVCIKNKVHDIVNSYDGRFWGIIVGSGAPARTIIYNNEVWNVGAGSTQSGNGGIVVYTGSATEIYNNSVYNCAGHSLATTQAVVTGTTWKNNIGYAGALGDYRNDGASTTATNNLINQNPLWVNPASGNFDLSVGSPAIDTGATVGSVTTDINGITRPQGSAYDMGSREATSGGGGGATTVTIGGNSGQLGSVESNTMVLATPDTNYASDVTLEAHLFAVGNHNRGSIRFDLTSIPTSAILSAFTVYLYGYDFVGSLTNTIAFQRIRRVWTQAGETWNKYDGTNGWTTAGAADTTNDIVGTVSAQANIPNVTGVYYAFSGATMLADAKSFVDLSVANNGWRLNRTDGADEGTDYRAFASWAAMDGQRPYAVATYTLSSVVAPTITVQPVSQTIASGATANLSVTATGTAPLTYQWFMGLTGDTMNPIANATLSTYTTAALASTTNYWVRVANTFGADSSTATITIGLAPTITVQPQSQSILTGLTAALSVTATGTGSSTYQWYIGSSGNTGSSIGGATSSTYTTAALSATTTRWVRVTNTYGTADSATATITVVVNTNLGTSDDILTPRMDENTAIAVYLQAYYGVVTPDINSLLQRYLREGSAQDSTRQWIKLQRGIGGLTS